MAVRVAHRSEPQFEAPFRVADGAFRNHLTVGVAQHDVRVGDAHSGIARF